MREDESVGEDKNESYAWTEALREEAEGLRPEFSRQRHQRIMQAIRDNPSTRCPRLEQCPRRRTSLAAVVCAVCLLCGVGSAAWWMSLKDDVSHQTAERSYTVEDADRTNAAEVADTNNATTTAKSTRAMRNATVGSQPGESDSEATLEILAPSSDWSLSELSEANHYVAATQLSVSVMWQKEWEDLDHDISRVAEVTVNQWPLQEIVAE